MYTDKWYLLEQEFPRSRGREDGKEGHRWLVCSMTEMVHCFIMFPTGSVSLCGLLRGSLECQTMFLTVSYLAFSSAPWMQVLLLPVLKQKKKKTRGRWVHRDKAGSGAAEHSVCCVWVQAWHKHWLFCKTIRLLPAHCLGPQYCLCPFTSPTTLRSQI